MVSEAQKKAVIKYKKANYERVVIEVRKGTRDIIKEIATEKGKSINRYVLDLIEQDTGKRIL